MESQTPEQKGKQLSSENTSPKSDSLYSVKHVTAWVMIFSAVIFALVGVLAVWQVFGSDAQDVVWRAFISLVIISFAALVANLGASIPKSK